MISFWLLIMNKVNDFIKTYIRDYVPTSCSTTSHDNNARVIKEFTNVNNDTRKNFKFI